MIEFSAAATPDDGDVLVAGLTKEGVPDAPDGLGQHLADRGFEGALGVVAWVPGADGSRLSIPRMAFRACVARRAPAPMAAAPTPASASVCPTAAIQPRAVIRRIAPRAPGR